MADARPPARGMRQRAPIDTHRPRLIRSPLRFIANTLEKQMSLSRPRAGVVQEAAEGCIQDRTRRLEWAQFDHEFLSACMKRVTGSWICVPESFRRFSIPDERLLLLSEQIYLESLRRTKQAKDPDGRILRDLTQAYADARSYSKGKLSIQREAGMNRLLGYSRLCRH